jgi:hypothetical protein
MKRERDESVTNNFLTVSQIINTVANDDCVDNGRVLGAGTGAGAS